MKNQSESLNTTQYPQEIIPILDVLLLDSSDYGWLNNFYTIQIHQKIEHIVNHEVFGPNSIFTEQYPDSTPLERLRLLKAYFTRETFQGKNPKDFLAPLKSVISNSNIKKLNRELENKLVRAIARGNEGVSLATRLHANSLVLLKHLLESEVLLMMKRKIESLQKDNIQHPQFTELKAWIAKELAQLSPVKDSLDLDARRFSLMENKKIKQDFSWHDTESIWYFLNGAPRINLFLQNEILAFKRTQKRFWQNVRILNSSISQGKMWKEALVYTPLKGLRFCWDLIKWGLTPYRFARSLVNELHYLLSELVENLLYKNKVNNKANKKRFLIHGGAALMQLLIYVGLLLSFGLPILPNPISWMPNVAFMFFPFSVLGYSLATYLCGMLTYSRDDELQLNGECLDPDQIQDKSYSMVKSKLDRTLEVTHKQIPPALIISKDAADYSLPEPPKAIAKFSFKAS